MYIFVLTSGRKYDRSKIIVDGFKSNEDALTQNLQIAEEKLKQNEAKYESLKTYAKSQIEKWVQMKNLLSFILMDNFSFAGVM